MMSLLFALPAPDSASFQSVLQPLFMLGLGGVAIGALSVGAGFLVGYLVYLNATKDRSADSH